MFGGNHYVSCNFLNQTDQQNLQGQQIENKTRGNNVFDCLNRQDEDPFSKKKEEKTNKPKEKGYLYTLNEILCWPISIFVHIEKSRIFQNCG